MENKTQTEAVIETVELLGGFATLQELYCQALTIPGVVWKTKTPDASIRRIVQTSGHFFNIRPGLWALKKFKDKLPRHIEELQEKKVYDKSTPSIHSYYQGLLVELGNLMDYSTYIPPQDKNKIFVNKPLCKVATLEALPPFTYEEVLGKVKSIDVIWMNQSRLSFPAYVFEIENSTDFLRSLTKFFEIRDFTTQMLFVAPDRKKKQFNEIINSEIFMELKNRVKFWSYDYVDQVYNSSFPQAKLKKQMKLLH
ncbi:hypothetical protein [Paenibacillus sp. sgz302251]|uniref:hypothetical protein n=1 Tax=Paenibacillus sp. sgz302251 TaxID=3414493 RepID=UPI003C7A46C3